MTAACVMVDIVLRLRIGVKDVTGDDVGGNELSQVAQQRLIARSNHSVAARGVLKLITPALSNRLFEPRPIQCAGVLILIEVLIFRDTLPSPGHDRDPSRG
jgi:hypothetical protein